MPNAAFYQSKFWRDLRAERLRLDEYRCTINGCPNPAKIVEHTVTRPLVDGPCSVDRIELLRSRCRDHDNQVKERVAGKPERNRDGKTYIRGVDSAGSPIDPDHPWHRKA